MNPLTKPFNAKTASDLPPHLDFDTYLNAGAISNNPSILSGSSAIESIPPVQFVSALAHEVRNPLSNINMSVDLLKTAIKDKDLIIYLDIIKRNSIRINDMINTLHKDQWADEVQTEKHSIHQLLDEVLEMAEDRIRLKNIIVNKDYTTHDFKIVLNKPTMKIALTNIIINAIDAMTSVKGKLKLITKSMDGSYTIQIKDNGCGISKEDLQHIFEPYFTNKPGGLGLGLASTHDILHNNKVRWNVASVEGKGTSFMLFFDQR